MLRCYNCYTVILEIFIVNIFVGPPNDEIYKHEFVVSYNEKLYVCVPERGKMVTRKFPNCYNCYNYCYNYVMPPPTVSYQYGRPLTLI